MSESGGFSPNTKNEPVTNPAFLSGAPPKTILREYAEQFLITVVMALFLMTFITQAVQVPTGSMQNNIYIGDHFFVNKFIFGRTTPVIGKLLPTREIKRGDIIVFKFPSDPKVNYVKRVIGLPGDTVEVKGTSVFVNGKELPEQHVTINIKSNQSTAQPELKTDAAPTSATYKVYLDEDANRDVPQGEYAVNGPVTVPADSYFAMGDSRDNSLDSRFWGFVPRSNIIGHALYVYWSYNPSDPDRERSGNPVWDILRHSLWTRTGTAIK
jgi:signal peptidase I